MKTKLYTATITAEATDKHGEIYYGDYLNAATFTTRDEAEDWLEEEESEIYRNVPRETTEVYSDIKEQEIDIPVFILTNVDYRDTDDNCGVCASVYPTEDLAVSALKDSVQEELEAQTIEDGELDWHNGMMGKNNMPDDPKIADTSRFGWTIDER